MKNELMPRERLIKYGKESLSDNELLAIILNTGIKDMNVFELSKSILSKYDISQIVDLSYEELINIKGISERKACLIISCFEFVKRSISINKSNLILNNSNAIYNFIKSDYLYEKRENIYLIIVNSKLKLIKKVFLNSGDVNCVTISHKNIVELLIKYNAYGCILCHNHPSNDTNPSKYDKIETIKLYKLLKELNYSLIDHIIVGIDNYFSFLENNLLGEDLM